jgi:hypothetical protein
MGHGVANDEMFDPVLEDRLNQDSAATGGPSWEILNLAVADHAAVEQLLFLRDRGLRFKPDVVFYFGHTRELAWTTKQLWQSWLNQREIPLLPLREMVLAAIDPEKPRPIQKQQVYSTSGEALAWIYREMVELCHANGITPVYVFLPRVEEFRAGAQRPFLLETAEEAGFYVLNIANLYGGQDREALKVSPTDYHPNPRGHGMIAQRLYDEIQQHGEEMGLPQASQTEEGSP